MMGKFWGLYEKIILCHLSLIASRRLVLLAKLRRGMNNVYFDMTLLPPKCKHILTFSLKTVQAQY